MAAPIAGPWYQPSTLLNPDRVELLHWYQQGGFHPIIIGDILGGRYRVYDKLGNSDHSTVWLCLDRKSRGFKWCAIKVLTARMSDEDSNEIQVARILRRLYLKGSHLCPPWSHFWIDGPNGRHLCFVSEVLGPSVIELHSRNNGDLVKDAMFQAAEAIQCLHQHGICHGNLTPSNILFRFPSLGRVNEDEMRNLLGPPRRETVVFLNEEATRRGPRYIYEPKALPIDHTDQIAVIDFDGVFEIDEPPEDILLPLAYRSPEVYLSMDFGPRLDIWALVNTILEVRTGETMFDGRYDESLVRSFETKLGMMPDPYNTIEKMRRGGEFGFHNIILDPGVPVSMPLYLLDFRTEQVLENSGFTEMFLAEVGRTRWLTHPNGVDRVAWRVHPQETDILADLLRRSFQYNRTERLDLAGIMDHEWFDGRESRVRNPGRFRVLVELCEFLEAHWRFCLSLLVSIIICFFVVWWRQREVVSGICKATHKLGLQYRCHFVIWNYWWSIL